jgi:hypothetical protein
MLLRKTTRLDEETGQLIETSVTVTVKERISPYFISFHEASKRYMFLTSAKAIQLFGLLCEHMTYESNLVDLTDTEAAEIDSRLGTNSVYRWRLIKMLILAGLVHRLGDNKYYLNPMCVWKGRSAVRRDYLIKQADHIKKCFTALEDCKVVNAHKVYSKENKR